MNNILISGLVNVETTVPVRQFPVAYYPIDYPFFGVNTAPAGVAYNIARALTALGDAPTLLSMTGADDAAGSIRRALREAGVSDNHILPRLRQTPASVVLYDPQGRRQIYCDLKDIQETPYPFDRVLVARADLVAACNINFSRPLLALARAAGVPIATDVHVLSRTDDEFNREFMEQADILFLSDEAIGPDYRGFLGELARRYDCRVIVLGRGGLGAAMYVRAENRLYELPAAPAAEIVSTVGAGDALFSGFLHALAAGAAPLEALVRAELFAAAKLRSRGAGEGFLTAQALEEQFARHGDELLAAGKCWEGFL